MPRQRRKEVMKKPVEPDQDFVMWVLINQSRDLLFRAWGNELEEHSLTTMQSIVLDIVNKLGNKASPTGIAKWLLREPNSISSLLIRMEKQGLVTRSVNPDKKRKVDIALTEKGKQAFRHSLKKDSIHDIMSCLSKMERQTLMTLVRKVRDKALTKVKEVREIPFP